MIETEEYLDSNYPKARKVKELYISGLDYEKCWTKTNWEKLTGSSNLNDFINLVELNCSRNKLTNLIITNCSQLKIKDNLLYN